MKARIINNEIEEYNKNKKELIDIRNGKLITGWNYASNEQITEQGFIEPVTPQYDTETEQLNGLEIINGVITYKVITKPIMPKMFDVSKFKEDIKAAFGERMLVLYPMYAVILDNLKVPMLDEHYLTIKYFMYGWLQKGEITQADFDKFVQCFTNQDIDIINYE